jgi:hypothetical protein
MQKIKGKIRSQEGSKAEQAGKKDLIFICASPRPFPAFYCSSLARLPFSSQPGKGDGRMMLLVGLCSAL